MIFTVARVLLLGEPEFPTIPDGAIQEEAEKTIRGVFKGR
jgi:hypothetical protein